MIRCLLLIFFLSYWEEYKHEDAKKAWARIDPSVSGNPHFRDIYMRIFENLQNEETISEIIFNYEPKEFKFLAERRRRFGYRLTHVW